jgi:PKD repeat protein
VVNSGWILTGASAINDNGDIVGSGLLDGQVHGFLLVANPPALVAGASANRTVGRAPFTVRFSSAGSSDGNYSWNFGDDTSDVTEADPSHVYTAPGNYIAVLTVTDSQGDSATSQVEIRVFRPKGGGPLTANR